MELKCPECNGEVREWDEELRCWSCGHILEYTEANRKHADAKEGRILAHGKSKSNEKSNIKNKQSAPDTNRLLQQIEENTRRTKEVAEKFLFWFITLPLVIVAIILIIQGCD
jgi:uncharacterized Zn finger protein (UPF0148 family)